MKVVEKFVSINGESSRAGELAVFIRFQGCNLNCSYCDTRWANQADCPFEEMTPEEIVAYIRQTQVKNVTLTGGEPLLQKDLEKLIDLIYETLEARVEIETNGSMDISALQIKNRPVFTVDYKAPTSGCEKQMLCSNFQYLTPQDNVKFVVGSRQDLDRAWEVIGQYQLTGRCHIYLSPVFGQIDPKEIVAYMIEKNMNDVRMQIQIHKVVWDPNEKGV